MRKRRSFYKLILEFHKIWDIIKNCPLLARVTFDNGIEKIGKWAFEKCNKLTSITLPASVTSIDDRAFERCDGLTRITLPRSVRELESWVFINCSGLIRADLSRCQVRIIPYGLFEYCTKLQEVKLPDGVDEIKDRAFGDTKCEDDIRRQYPRLYR